MDIRDPVPLEEESEELDEEPSNYEQPEPEPTVSDETSVESVT